MSSDAQSFDAATAKLIASAVIVALLALAAISMLLPLVPALLLVAIAVLVAAKLSPAFARMLRQNATLAGYLDRTDGFRDLPLRDKIRSGCLLCAKIAVDAVTALVAAVMRLLNAVERA